jgi:hypothetical protein
LASATIFHGIKSSAALKSGKYTTNLLTRAGMSYCTSCPTPLSATDSLAFAEGSPLGSEDITRYRSIVGALQYLTLTRPDHSFIMLISYANIFMLQRLHIGLLLIGFAVPIFMAQVELV